MSLCDPNPDAKYIIVDVGFRGSSGAMSIARPRSASLTKDDLRKLKMHPRHKENFIRAIENGTTGATENLNILCYEPTYIIFKAIHKNWSFDSIDPVDIASGLSLADEFELIPLDETPGTIVVYNRFTNYGEWKYGLNIDIKQGRGRSQALTRIVIDPCIGNHTPP